jgi:ATPase family associated with various cellular activities (AAA)
MRREAPFSDLPPLPAQHFRLLLLAAVSRLLDRAADALGSEEALYRDFPFLAGYREELLQRGFVEAGAPGAAALARAAAAWEADASGFLPLRALRAAGALDHDDLTLLLAAGLTEEDARFGQLFSALQGTPQLARPTLGLLGEWWRSPGGGEGRARVRRLQALGLLEVGHPDAPRSERPVQVPGPLWDALRGEVDEAPAPWARHRTRQQLMRDGPVVLPAEVAPWLDPLPRLLAAGEVQAVVIRGPRHNGRRSLLRALARALGRGTLELEAPGRPDDERWRLAGPLATLLHALPVVVLEPGPGEVAEVPLLTAADVAPGLVLGRQGGLSGPGVERAVTLTLEIPPPAVRREHWAGALGPAGSPDLDEIAGRMRMTSGNIRRAAALARTQAALAGRAAPTDDDVCEAARALHRQALDTLAARLPVAGDWSDLAVCGETLRELQHLEARCRCREALPGAVGGALARSLTPGVRALLQGPSGTGKTLAARLLGSALRMDVYRVDLAAVVNKYIGETEKNLARLFALAEELDVILLLDEGDALLARRTSVASSNDRYANLETNYLLQRIEEYQGILVVTTNAGDLIDGAFQRRLDVVVTFRAPDPAERWAIWQLHLPAAHAVDPALLGEVAARCHLGGGQIRNAVLHASVLALADGGPVRSEHLEAAVEREYRKVGGSCPLRGSRRA